MKTESKGKINSDQKKSKLGQIKIITAPQSSNVNNKLDRKSTKSKATFNPKTNKKNTKAKEAIKESININFKEEAKDESIEIPRSLLCNICHKLVKNPTKCYKCGALFCRDCLMNVLDKYHKCPKCFKVLSENLIKAAVLSKEFENTYIKCKYIGCKEVINLFNYEEHMNTCPFKNVQNMNEIENLHYINPLPFNEDPYSNSPLVNYSLKKIESDKKLDQETSYIRPKKEIEEFFDRFQKEKASDSIHKIFQNIIEQTNCLKDDLNLFINKKELINEEIKNLQKQIKLHDIVL